LRDIIYKSGIKGLVQIRPVKGQTGLAIIGEAVIVRRGNGGAHILRLAAEFAADPLRFGLV